MRALFSQIDTYQDAEGLFSSRWNALPTEVSELSSTAWRTLTSAVSSLTAQPQSPLAILTGLYQDLLTYHPRLVDGAVNLLPSRQVRKSGGVYYTPPDVTRLTVEAALRPLKAAPSVLDPAMGTGVFLFAAVRFLANRDVEDPADIAERCLHGFDTDPLAVELAILALWLETGARPRILRHSLRCADFLQQEHSDRGYDAILGNPPWGVPVMAGSGSVDSFKLFLDLSAQLTRGTLGIVVPQAVLSQTSHADIRARLLARLDPYWVADLGEGHFPDAAAPACALVFGPRPGPSRITCLDLRVEPGGVKGPTPHSLEAARWTASDFSLAPDRLGTLLRRLQADHPALGACGDALKVRDTGINYNRAVIAQRVLYVAEDPHDPRDLARFRGRDFGRYTGITRSGWLRHDFERYLGPGERLSFSRQVHASPQKIVLRQTADRIIATVDRSGMVMGRSVLAIIARQDISLPALLACLNSRLLTVLYRVMAGEEGRVLPQVKVARLHALPLPQVCTIPTNAAHEASPDRERWRQLDILGRALLAAEGQDTQLEWEIDHLVEMLYGLTADEISLVTASD